MTEIIYDKTWHHSTHSFIQQALDPCNTFEEYVRSGVINRQTAAEQAHQYMAWVLSENPEIEQDRDDWRSAVLTEADLTQYLLEMIERIEQEPSN